MAVRAVAVFVVCCSCPFDELSPCCGIRSLFDIVHCDWASLVCSACCWGLVMRRAAFYMLYELCWRRDCAGCSLVFATMLVLLLCSFLVLLRAVTCCVRKAGQQHNKLQH